MRNGDLIELKMKLAILDAGSQYYKLIDKKIRKLNVETVMLPLNYSLDNLNIEEIKGIIISGSPGSVMNDDALEYDPGIFELGIPILGICYGMQLIVKHFQGKVKKVESFRNDGVVKVNINTQSPLYAGIPSECNVLLTHGDCCVGCPYDFNGDVMHENYILYGISNIKKNIYGVQFHPEVELTEIGDQLFTNFLFNICGFDPSYTLHNRMESKILELQKLDSGMNDCKFVVFVSGGVDSFVTVKLMLKAFVPSRIIAVHVNTGFMRQNESETVCQILRKNGVEVIYLDCTADFLNGNALIETSQDKSIVNILGYDLNGTPIAFNGKPLLIPAINVPMNLCEVTNPEFKRKIIGDIFMKIYKEQIIKKYLNNDTVMLVQGTLRPDLIESASKLASSNADTIKTHHNDSPEVRRLRDLGLVLEPLSDFHKDEVREIGKELKLDKSIVHRQPFPGPGLAIRILCADSLVENFQPLLSQKMLNYMINYKMIENQKLTKSNMQGCLKVFSEKEIEHLRSITNHELRLFAHILPVNSVGVQGDERTYKNVVVLSSNAKPNWPNVAQLVPYILRICSQVNRICYAFGPCISDSSITCLTQTRLNHYTVDIIRRADFIVNSILEEYEETIKIAQMPVILLPVHFDNREAFQGFSKRYSIVLRPIITQDFMTGEAAVPSKTISEDMLYTIDEHIKLKLPVISRVLIDLTSKPPGTIEWE